MQERRILLLSGPVASGKSTISLGLVNAHGFKSIRSGAYLQAQARAAGLDESRRGLQEFGDRKDAETDFAWLIDEVAAPLIEGDDEQRRWLLDSVRKPQQVAHFRRAFCDQIVHLHLTAPETELRRRYEERAARGGDYLGATPYDQAITHTNELASRSLVGIADVVYASGEGVLTGLVNCVLACRNQRRDFRNQPTLASFEEILDERLAPCRR